VVYNAYGFAVATNKVSAQKGINNLSVPVNNLRPGLYFVEMQYGKHKNRTRFQKL
jgi:hypothetical protein